MNIQFFKFLASKGLAVSIFPTSSDIIVFLADSVTYETTGILLPLKFIYPSEPVLTIFVSGVMVSSPGEFHPQALSDPYVNLSIHTAPIIQP
jgi:hypothetical protein